jgi:DNA repair photolyase
MHESENTGAGVVRGIMARSALHYHANEMPTHWDLNVYRGCGHGCAYCFARYSHEYLGSDDFFGDICVKQNIAAVLDRELSRRSWRHSLINLSGVTDAYQPAEATLQVMPAVWRVLLKHRNPVVLTTKSALLMRDLPLIRELASVTTVYIGASITMLDERMRTLFEPGAATAGKRFTMLEAAREAGCITNILLTPLLPLLTDTEENIGGIYSRAKEAGVMGLSAWPLNLRGSTRKSFLQFLGSHFPELVNQYQHLYQKQEVDPAYWNPKREMILRFREFYGLPGIRIEPTEAPRTTTQLSLF